MKQSMKRMYGTLAMVALVSGVTGAFAFSFFGNGFPFMKGGTGVQNENTTSVNETSSKSNFFRTSDDDTMPLQHIDLTGAAEKACAAVVYIKVTSGGETVTREYVDPYDDIFEYFFGRGQGNGGRRQQQFQTPKRQGAGSGVIISSDGYIVTNNHVVDGANDIQITLNDNREFKATVVGTDETTDLALLKINATDLPTLIIGDSDALKIGEWVLAVGNPFNLKSTVTAGIVSAKARKIDERTGRGNEIESYIQTDAAINAGNSGGALVNARGELVGINAALYSQTGNFTGYGFAIPTSIMKKVVNDLKEYGVVQRAMMGISGADLSTYIETQKRQDEKFNKDFGTNDGVYVADVSADGAAKEAGLQEGDIIIAVNDKKITKMSELQETVARYNPGDKVNIKYIRDKKEKSATITLKNNQGTTKLLPATNIINLGGEFAEITDKDKEEYDIKYGVKVSKLTAGGTLKANGVGEDFVIMMANNQKVSSVNDFTRIYQEALQSETKTLFLWGKYPSGRNGSYAIELK